MKTDSPCIKLSRQTAAGHEPMEFLRVEPNPACFYLFSYHHVDLAKFESVNDKEILTITFLNHRVRIEGKNLRVLAVELQSRSVEMVKPLPHRYGPAFSQEVCQIEVIEVEENTHPI